jgi:hypothetical protein
VALLVSKGSFDCVVVREANDTFAQDDTARLELFVEGL